MAKMVNPNSVNDMEIINAKAQAKMSQLVQKIGKGKRRVTVTFNKTTRSYVAKLIEEMKKQMIAYEKQLPNLFNFFNYLEKETKVTKANKKEKTKDVLLSYEEVDFLKLQLKETIKGIEMQSKNLKWYNFLKKSMYKMLKKQPDETLENVNSGNVKKK